MNSKRVVWLGSLIAVLSLTGQGFAGGEATLAQRRGKPSNTATGKGAQATAKTGQPATKRTSQAQSALGRVAGRVSENAGSSSRSGLPASREDAAPPIIAATGSVVAGGGNNLCSLAQAIQSTGVFAFDNTLAGGSGPDHPACLEVGQTGIDNDVWFLWLAPENCIATIDTCGGQTTVDSKIAVYDDGAMCPPTDLDLLGCSDDICGTNGIQSSVTWQATGGSAYRIRLGVSPIPFAGNGPGTGTFTISCQPAPICTQPAANCQAQDVNNASSSDRTQFVVADGFSPAQNGAVTEICWWGAYLDNGSTDCQGIVPDTFQVKYYQDDNGLPGLPIATFTGASLSVTGVQDTGDMVAGLVTEYAFTATHAALPVFAGECYWVEISNFVDSGDGCTWFWEYGLGGDGRVFQDTAPFDGYGPFDLASNDLAFCVNVPLGPPGACLPAVPPNDDCAGAIPIVEGETVFDTTSATTDGPFEPACFLAADNDPLLNQDIWFSFVSTCDDQAGEVLLVSLCDSLFDSKVAVYGANQCPPQTTPLACNDDFCGADGLASQVIVNTVMGKELLMRVGGFGNEVGPGTLRLTCGQLPPNDNCADTPIEPLAVGAPVLFTGDNTFATNDCPIFKNPDGHVWIAFDLLVDGSVTIDYTGSVPPFEDAWLNLTTACPCGGLSAPPICQPTNTGDPLLLTWDCLTAGTYYYPVLTSANSEGMYNITVTTEPCICGPDSGDCLAAGGNGTPGCNDATCCSLVCDADPVCCCTSWDGICASLANTMCGPKFETFCLSATGDCLSAQAGGGCDSFGCCRDVCDLMPECCEVEWSAACAAQAVAICPIGQFDAVCAGLVINVPPLDCCTSQTVGGCSTLDCCTAVCECDPFCCDVSWDSFCSGKGNADSLCGANALCGTLCATCPEGVFACDSPVHFSRDAGQPHAHDDPTIGQGTKILTVIGTPGADNPLCWTVGETNINAALRPSLPSGNSIISVTESPPGTYAIELLHPLTPGETSTLTYASDTGASTLDCSYIVLPGDVDGNGITDAADIVQAIDGLGVTAGTTQPPTDVDRNGAIGATDITRLLDLLNGGGDFESWFNATVTAPSP